MTIDTDELRRLAEAALNDPGEVFARRTYRTVAETDLIRALSPAAVLALLDRLAAAEAERAEPSWNELRARATEENLFDLWAVIEQESGRPFDGEEEDHVAACDAVRALAQERDEAQEQVAALATALEAVAHETDDILATQTCGWRLTLEEIETRLTDINARIKAALRQPPAATGGEGA